MPQEIRKNLYKIEIPLPQTPLKALNCYIVRGPRTLIIDTGFNREECRSAMETGLRELGVDLASADLLFTHSHSDHCGLVGALTRPDSKIYCSQADAAAIASFSGKNTDYMEKLTGYGVMTGFSAQELQEMASNHPGYKYRPMSQVDFTVIEDGDAIAVGDYFFRCVATPGHTKGHMCLYEPYGKILIAGDHILGDITPNISLRSDTENPLQSYLESLDKVARLGIDLVLPGHRGIITDCYGRIKELKAHYLARAEEVYAILAKAGQNACQVAQQMKWDIKYDSWNRLPITQRWFATGEATAHLKYLVNKGLIYQRFDGRHIVYHRTA